VLSAGVGTPSTGAPSLNWYVLLAGLGLTASGLVMRKRPGK
jgi:LPXTG-motif cell wall-anchored protein